RVVGIVLVVELRGMEALAARLLAGVRTHLDPRLARGALELHGETAVADRRIRLQPLGPEARIAQAVDEDLRDPRPLLRIDRLLLDDRRHRQDLAVAPAELVLELGRVARVLE